jgi:hypothetical protein
MSMPFEAVNPATGKLVRTFEEIRAVARISNGMIGPRAAGVPLAVTRPIANILVVAIGELIMVIGHSSLTGPPNIENT